MRIPDNTELADAILSGDIAWPLDPARPYDAPRICPVSYTHLTLPTTPYV